MRRVAPGRTVVVLCVAAVVLIPTGCSGGTSAADGKLIPVTTTVARGSAKTRTSVPSTSTTAPQATTTTTTLPVIAGVDPTLEKTVWDAYLAAWTAVDEAASTSDPDSPVLAQHLTNSSLEGWRKTLTQRRDDGEYVYYRSTTQHRDRLYGMTVKYPTWVDIDTCEYDDGVVGVKATGAVVDDKPGLTRYDVTMWLVAGTWRMAGTTGQDVAEDQCPDF